MRKALIITSTSELTPVMLWKLMVRTKRTAMEAGLNRELTERGLLPEGGEVNWQLVARASTGLAGRVGVGDSTSEPLALGPWLGG